MVGDFTTGPVPAERRAAGPGRQGGAVGRGVMWETMVAGAAS